MTNLPYAFTAGTVSKSGLRKKKGCDLLAAAKHNCRELKAELGEYGRIEPTMSHLNEYLIGPSTAEEIATLAADDLHVPDRAGRAPRHDHAQAIELIFSLPLSFGWEVSAFFRDCVGWAAKAFSGHKIYSAVIHYDEGAPHCHVLISPIRNGIRVGSEVIDLPALNKLKDKFWCEFAAPRGLAMPAPKLKGARKREAVQQVMEFLSTERKPCVESLLWPVIQAAINNNPAMALHLLKMNLDGTVGDNETLTCVGITSNKPADQSTTRDIANTLPLCPSTSTSRTFGARP